jgi:aerobic-type carbon monoxide dehydrogenase small subunit (CoxS/CutS family)
MNAGHEIITIEGLSSGDGDLHPMQQAFIDHDCWFSRGTEPVGVRIKSWTAL